MRDIITVLLFLGVIGYLVVTWRKRRRREDLRVEEIADWARDLPKIYYDPYLNHLKDFNGDVSVWVFERVRTLLEKEGWIFEPLCHPGEEGEWWKGSRG